MKSDIYVRPFHRIAPYLVGIIMADLLHHYKDKKMPKVTDALGRNMDKFMLAYQVTFKGYLLAQIAIDMYISYELWLLGGNKT